MYTFSKRSFGLNQLALGLTGLDIISRFYFKWTILGHFSGERPYFASCFLRYFVASMLRYIAASWKYVKMLAESRTRQIKFNLGATDGVAVGTVTQEVNGGRGGR